MQDPALPSDVTDAIALVLTRHQESPEIKKALHTLHSFEESMVLVEVRLVHVKTGKHVTAVTHRFKKLGIDVSYHDGKFIGASRVISNDR